MKSAGLEKQDALLTKLDSSPIYCPSCRQTHAVKDIAQNYKLGMSCFCKCSVTKEVLRRDFTLFGAEQFFTIIN